RQSTTRVKVARLRERILLERLSALQCVFFGHFSDAGGIEIYQLDSSGRKERLDLLNFSGTSACEQQALRAITVRGHAAAPRRSHGDLATRDREADPALPGRTFRVLRCTAPYHHSLHCYCRC